MTEPTNEAHRLPASSSTAKPRSMGANAFCAMFPMWRLGAEAPDEGRCAFGLAEEEEKIGWWWPRLTLLAQLPEVAKSAPET